MKIDVEGHEKLVFEGAIEHFKHGLIENILFEDNNKVPNDVTCFLESHNFTIYRIVKGWFGLKLLDYRKPYTYSGWDASNFLAIHNSAKPFKLSWFYKSILG
jgi:hypothetical protein